MDSRPFPRFGLQLERGLEEVDVETGNLVESTQCRCFTQPLQSAITNQLANNGSVLLFDPRLIVLSIGAAASENDALLLAIIQQSVVHECAVVVCIQSEQGKCAKNVRGGYAQCCIRDGGRPTGVGLQGLISNYRMLLNW